MTELGNLQIANPAKRALTHAGFKYLEELTKVSGKYLLSLHGIGPNAIKIIKLELNIRKLSLKSE
jgi:hypothetical protein